MTIFIALPDIG